MIHVFSNLEEPGDGLAPMCDLTFDIVEAVYDEAGSCWRLEFRADATPHEPVGFMAIIPVSGWREQIDFDGDDALYSFWGSITLCSCGIQSDRLLALIAEHYGIPTSRPKSRWPLVNFFARNDRDIATRWKFANSIECLAVGINTDPAFIADGLVRMKLFLDDGIEDGRYAEVFLKVDLSIGLAALSEKDEAYRADLVRWLSFPGNVVAKPVAAEAEPNH
ncbi:hypothetical protein [Kaistia terrae]|uniref:Uncharacterized protein n=1 Tax=Kaistia terrae TaxID=537017 RepID=A0ABW0PUD0_9HYPH|nr:hypothetical protein [Kaistia terrae]MCX5577236.1 hypothetical protein [Kaistia terrae]